MIITIKSLEPSILQITFTQTELQHSLFQATLNKMYNSDEYDTHKKDDNINVTLLNENSYEVIGQTVDEIRELWCGDVLFTYDGEGNPLPKDLSKCPCFILGQTDEVDPIQEDI